MTEPKCIEVLCSASSGGKIQVKQFDISVDYHYSISRKYTVPEDWTEDDIEGFQIDKTLELRGQIEPLAQAECDDLLEQRRENDERAR